MNKSESKKRHIFILKRKTSWISMLKKKKNKDIVKDLKRFHEIVAGCSRGMDAVYEDYVLFLIGQEGFDMLRKNHILEPCGSIDGRNLYTVKGVEH